LSEKLADQCQTKSHHNDSVEKRGRVATIVFSHRSTSSKGSGQPAVFTSLDSDQKGNHAN
jgi:hypothetical protein